MSHGMGDGKRVKPSHLNTLTQGHQYPPATPALELQTPAKRLDFDNIEQSLNESNISIQSTAKKRVKEVASRFMLPSSSVKNDARNSSFLNTSALNSSMLNTSMRNTSMRNTSMLNTSTLSTKKSSNTTRNTSIMNGSFQVAPPQALTRRPKVSAIGGKPNTSATANSMSASARPLPSKVQIPSTLQPDQQPATKPPKNPTSNTLASITSSNNPEILRQALALHNNLLLQYSYCNALAQRQQSQQKEKTEKVLVAAFNKVHELREEVHKNNLLLSQYKYLISLDEILTLQETNLQFPQLTTSLDHYQTITKSILTTLNLMPVNMAIHSTKLLETISNITSTLACIKKVVGNNASESDSWNSVDLAANSLHSISVTMPQQAQKLAYCKSLLQILNAIENQLTSLNIQLIEEKLFDEL
eukprot:Phypoly_transcript_09340.p1 GENE.Phypoly_transcript_09340~~Phypoly_transcript_09340.p1  ORF type:complete len:416 (+),score=56.76 Phypoly_transcript_09340:132-1379(+)